MDWLAKQDAPLEGVAIDPKSMGLDGHMANEAGNIRLRPDFWANHGGMDGFFVAKLKRKD